MNRAPPTVCDICLLKLHAQRLREPRSVRPMDFPLEILVMILDCLPQHRVYPFLSLSKGVNHIANQRLFRQVYVLTRGAKPLLHDAVDELLQWLYLTESQFLHLMRYQDKWHGRLVIFEWPQWSEPVFNAIKKHLLLAEVVIPKPMNARNSHKFIISLPIVSRLASITLEGPIVLEPVSIKLKVDSLRILGDVKGIKDYIDLSSVRQISLIDAYAEEDGNIYQLAQQLVRLENLLIAENYRQERLQCFPTTVKKLVYLCDLQSNIEAFPFQMLLEYLELDKFCQRYYWPRRLLNGIKDPSDWPIVPALFPRLKVFVVRGEVYKINRLLGEYFSTEKIN